MAWTRFVDMHSGGGQKLKWDRIFIEAPEGQARAVFYAKFGRNPDRVTCTCCGPDYSVSESETLEQETAFDRGCHFDKGTNRYEDRPAADKCAWNKYQTLDSYREIAG